MSSPNRTVINLKMCEGARFQADFTWEVGSDEEGWEGVDLTGCTAKMEIRAGIKAATFLASLTTANGKLAFTNQAVLKGGYGCDLPGADSEGWCPAHEDVRAAYDLFIYDSDGNARNHQGGELLIEAAVTRPWEATP